jgi:hypothetical protein
MQKKGRKNPLYAIGRITKSDECPVCSGTITDGVAYFCFGAVIDCLVMEEKNLDDTEIEGFCNIGYHGADSEMRDSADFCVAENVRGGQQEISFCSLDCLRQWFCGIVDYLEQELSRCKPKEGTSELES